MMLAARAAAVVAGCLLMAVVPRSSAARPAHVNVIRSEGADAIILEITNRTRAELIAAGIDAAIVDCPRAADCRDRDVGAAPPPGDGQRAVVTTERDGDQTVTEVKVATLAAAAPLVLRLAVGADSADHDDPPTLAVRAAELVRSALLQASGPAPATAPVSAPPAISYDFELPRRETAVVGGVGWFAGVGGAILDSRDGLGTAYGLVLRGGYSGLRWPGLTVAVLVAAPSLAAELHFDDGKVAVRQELAAAQAGLRFRTWARLQPRISLGAGAYHVVARGIAEPQTGYVGTTSALWTAILTAGGGAAFVLTDGFIVFADLQAVVAFPYPSFAVGWQRARGADPSFLASLGIERLF
ncbi:MAG TPA: hypothetical protein VNO55_01785 [Polyangia bacterium]|nr:hypothetical protein [Polyangia bacterium]